MGLAPGSGGEQMRGRGLRFAGTRINEIGKAAGGRMNQGGPGMGLATGYGNEQQYGRGATHVAPNDGFQNMMIERGGDPRFGMR
jgi:hypothetical protein